MTQESPNPFREWMRVVLPMACLLAGCGAGWAAQASSVSPPPADFSADFNGNAHAVLDGKPVEPTVARGLKYVPGIRGKAVHIGIGRQAPNGRTDPQLIYSMGDLFKSPAGTVAFWFRPDWNGSDKEGTRYGPFHTFLDGYAGDTAGMNDAQRLKSRHLWMFMGAFLRCDLHKRNDDKPASLMVRRTARASWQSGGWQHVALTWDRDSTRLYLNGRLYPPGSSSTSQIADAAKKGMADLRGMTSLVLGGYAGERTRANGTFDELRIYRQALSSDQVAGMYYRNMPVDVVAARRFVTDDQPTSLALNLYPAGEGDLPKLEDMPKAIPNGATISMSLTDEAGKILARTEPVNLASHAPGTLKLKVPPLAEGNYKLHWTTVADGATCTQAVAIRSFKMPSAAETSDAPPKLGQAIDEIDCTKSGHDFIDSGKSKVVKIDGKPAYREAGPNDMDRFSYVLNFPKPDGQPVMLEITWPDDKPRSMGLYMYRSKELGAYNDSRDRLEGGIQAGEEFPSSGKMKTVRYLFYPWGRQYLFEARTKIKGYPAAVASIKVYPVIGRLPKLPILTPPKGLPQRHFGDVDEDQSFELLLVDPNARLAEGTYPVEVISRLLDYMDYTGQDTLAYAFERYSGSFDPAPSQVSLTKFLVPGWQRLLLDMFEHRGKRLWAVANIYSPTAIANQPEKWAQWVKDGVLLSDLQGRHLGRTRPVANPASASAQRIYIDQISRMMKYFGDHPALAGVDLWAPLDHSPLLYPSLEVGYDDATIKAFERDTGKKVTAASDGMERFSQRQKSLTTGPLREAWLNWRAEQVTKFIRKVADAVHEIHPKLPLRITLVGLAGEADFTAAGLHSKPFTGSTPLSDRLYTRHGLNLKAISSIPNVSVTPSIQPTLSRWRMHRQNGQLNNISAVFDDLALYGPFRSQGESVMEMFLTYYESFNPSLKPKEFPSYFQNADIKANGRFFLGTLSRNMAMVDADQTLIGGQPLGTSGRDAQARAFAKAYRALPAGRYQDVEGSGDPVIARTLHTSQGEYLYLVNLVDADIRVGLQGGASSGWTDLSTHKPVEAVVTLKPFELLSLKGQAAPAAIHVDVSEASVAPYKDKLNDLKESEQAILNAGGSLAAYEKTVKRIESAIDAHQLYLAHRLIFSSRMRKLTAWRKLARAGYIQAQARMMKRGFYAVDCGSADYYTAHDGTLFFPDQPYTPGSYGYFGPRKAAGRSIDGITGADDPQLYATESYDMDGYRFTVPNGDYQVKIFLKIGYAPGQKPGVFRFNLSAEGHPVVNDYDVFLAQKNDPNHVAILTIDRVHVSDGVLDLTYGVPPGADPTGRIADAIVVKSLSVKK